ncbi:hypothetical protein MIND_00177400 [Mycena indigotica]|uniref:Uncharacterized protein n=1 Tax=Mycena indigotica TaxID=2126181 RepID=A0A8H6WG92_9AGAR|nr:uncharacterized protein MIND_00177400 [Mycena indigotica]KAF7316577.1 hypothetical protein MIND_00177400 [Mycena indigotica]
MELEDGLASSFAIAPQTLLWHCLILAPTPTESSIPILRHAICTATNNAVKNARTFPNEWQSLLGRCLWCVRINALLILLFNTNSTALRLRPNLRYRPTHRQIVATHLIPPHNSSKTRTSYHIVHIYGFSTSLISYATLASIPSSPPSVLLETSSSLLRVEEEILQLIVPVVRDSTSPASLFLGQCSSGIAALGWTTTRTESSTASLEFCTIGVEIVRAVVDRREEGGVRLGALRCGGSGWESTMKTATDNDADALVLRLLVRFTSLFLFLSLLSIHFISSLLRISCIFLLGPELSLYCLQSIVTSTSLVTLLHNVLNTPLLFFVVQFPLISSVIL